MLYEFIAVNREEIIRRCRAKVATRTVPPPTEAEIDQVLEVLPGLVGKLRALTGRGAKAKGCTLY